MTTVTTTSDIKLALELEHWREQALRSGQIIERQRLELHRLRNDFCKETLRLSLVAQEAEDRAAALAAELAEIKELYEQVAKL